ncbi:SAM-dependent methyltransferase [Candidatus Woesearchaeota archaeon]|jgi:ubiquinone/menaquinone biosynthesis C-methylase UbiE|nr:SAM-dependent methyltransferase [Candidatus Woesearchaeota archaeon]|tara:strand:- start:336 stop:848 length:513 start_codon:yes stop_codon:yes gene_type:complete
MQKYSKTTIESYDKTVDDYADMVRTLSPSKESKIFLSLIGRNSSILDLGCGPGRDSKIFADKGYKVVGIDLSRRMIKSAKKFVKNADFKVIDMMNLNLKTNSFDGIWANAALLHLRKRDFPKALKGVYRILKKDGIFYLSLKQGKGEGIVSDHRYGGIKKFWSFFQKNEI